MFGKNDNKHQIHVKQWRKYINIFIYSKLKNFRSTSQPVRQTADGLAGIVIVSGMEVADLDANNVCAVFHLSHSRVRPPPCKRPGS